MVGPMWARAVAAVAGVVALLAACTAPSGDVASPTSPATDTSGTSIAPTESASATPTDSARLAEVPDVPEPPEEDACYRLRFDDLPRTSSDSNPVPCGQRHNAQTIHVGKLDAVVDGRPTTLDSRAVQHQVSTTCPRRLARYLGGDRSTRALSRFHAVWFTPTLEDFGAGANWFRCDLVAFAGHERLADLPRPRRLAGVLDDSGALATWGLCGTAAPGAPAFSRVICSEPHTWRATSTITIPGGRRYPGTARVRTAGDETCKERVRRLSGSALRFRYGWEWPTRDQWARGQHYGFCWAPDRSSPSR